MREDPDRVPVDEPTGDDGDDSVHNDMPLTDAERAEIAASANVGLLKDD